MVQPQHPARKTAKVSRKLANTVFPGSNACGLDLFSKATICLLPRAVLNHLHVAHGFLVPQIFRKSINVNHIFQKTASASAYFLKTASTQKTKEIVARCIFDLSIASWFVASPLKQCTSIQPMGTGTRPGTGGPGGAATGLSQHDTRGGLCLQKSRTWQLHDGLPNIFTAVACQIAYPFT